VHDVRFQRVQPGGGRGVPGQRRQGRRPVRGRPDGAADDDRGQERPAADLPPRLHDRRRPRRHHRLQGRRPDPPRLVPQPGRQPGGHRRDRRGDLPGPRQRRPGGGAGPHLRRGGRADAELRRVPEEHRPPDPGRPPGADRRLGRGPGPGPGGGGGGTEPGL
ncbi:MAG: AclJ, partial [uncultured Thermomicrobiales bacterium]